MDEDGFMKEYNALFERALIFSMLSRSMGLASLRDSLDKEKKLLKTIKKDAALSIQHHIPPEELLMILNSYVNIELDAAWEKYNAINDFISKAITDQFRKLSDRQTEIYKDISEKIVSLLTGRQDG